MEQPILMAAHTYDKHPDLKKFYMHTHTTYEIYCFLSGNAKYFVEGAIYKLKPNDILIMKKAEAHSLLISKDAPYERMVINFNEAALLGDNAENLLSFIDNRPLGDGNLYPASSFAEYRWTYYIKSICDAKDILTKRLYLTVLLTELCNLSNVSEENEEFKDNISKVIAYINLHLAEDLSLDILSDKFYISKSHLNRKFKKLTGSTVWEYIKTKRLVMAKEMLQKGVKPTAAATQCGFNEYSSFFHAYKLKFGVSPKEDMQK